MRRLRWRGYEVSFHDFKQDDNRREYNIVLHLPFGPVVVGSLVRTLHYRMRFYAQNIGWSIVGTGKIGWIDNGPGYEAVTEMLDFAYPDLEAAV